MRTFAVLSFAVAAFAAPAAFVPGLANAVVPVKAPVNANANAVTGVLAYADAAVANVNAADNTIGNNDVNGNNVKVLARGLADVFTPVVAPINAHAGAATNVVANAKAAAANVNAQDNTIGNNDVNYNDVKVLSRGVVDAVGVVSAVIKGLVDLCTEVGVDANAAIANVGLKDNTILNNVLNGNNVHIGKRDAVNALTPLTTAVVALVQALTSAGVEANAIIGNVQATCNNIGNNVGNDNTVSVLSRGVVDAAAPVLAVVDAVVAALTKVGVVISADVLNVALQKNNILNGVLNGNNVNALSG